MYMYIGCDIINYKLKPVLYISVLIQISQFKSKYHRKNGDCNNENDVNNENE